MSDKMKRDLQSLVLPRVHALKAYHLDHHDVSIKLDQNENTLGVPEPIRVELERRLEAIPLHRYPTPDLPEIRSALSKAFDWPVEGILVGNGSDDLLNTVAHATLEPGRAALAPTPSFFAYRNATLLQGAELVEIQLDAQFRYDVGAFLSAIDAHEPHLIFLCSPNNPTGTVLAPEDIRRIAERAPGLVALDEAYWEFDGWNGRELLDELENLILFRTFSKALALAGLRVGFALLAPELRREIVKLQQPYVLNRLSQEAVLVALDHYDLVLEQAASIARARDALFARLEVLEGVEVFPSKANFLLFETCLGAKKTFDGLLERGVLVRDVSAHPLLRNTLRVAIGTPEENETFYEALEQTVGGRP